MLQWINKKSENKKIAKIIEASLFLVIFLFVFFVFDTALAQSVADPNSNLQQGMQVIQEPLGLPNTDIRLIIGNIIKTALSLLGIIAVIIIIYGGFLWMTSGGNETQIEKAKKVLVNAIIGLIIILSAYAIVFFVMRLLGVDVGPGNNNDNVNEPGTQNFIGSGSLGQIIRDHYPTRDQTGVPRNTKIAVTFNKPILVNNLVVDTNNDGIFGDCNINDAMNWETDCDALVMGDNFINISAVTKDDSGAETVTPIDGAALIASYVPSMNDPNVLEVYTIVIRPYNYLGSELEDVTYRVRLGSEIRLNDSLNSNPPAFTVKIVGNTFYEWRFICGTELDLTPPTVVDVFPVQDAREVKNTTIQITFNEAVDPIGIQGGFTLSADGSHYVLQGNNVFLKNENSTIPLGRFDLVNNYRTLEFTSTIACGVNACGKPVYCLPVCDVNGVNCKEANYDVLLRAGRTFSNSSFEAIPFSGVMDMSGNALDGNSDKKVDTAPLTDPVFPTQKVPDNFFWNFTLLDELDLTSPYVLQIVPGPESNYVPGNREWNMDFSKRMRLGSIYGIGLDESPTPAERCPDPTKGCSAEPLWRVPTAWVSLDDDIKGEKTTVRMNHGLFLEGLRQIYIPYINSSIEDVHYNCLYPGQGPNDNTDNTKDLSAKCVAGTNCCINNTDSETGDFCCNGQEEGIGEEASESCRDNLKLP